MNIIEKKRKIIDLDDNTFKILSIQAASKGTNLKVLIENILSNYVDNMSDVDKYKSLFQKDKT